MEEEIEEIEEWKECGESKKCFYEVSNFGRVKSVTKVNKKERILKGYQNKDGYLDVYIGKKKHRLIHTLVALAFLGPRPEGLVVDHFDRCKTNNKINNLRYCTYSENNENTDRYRSDILEQGVERKKILDKANREANKEKINEYNKEYYKANREALLEKAKEKYTCECGIVLAKYSKSDHERSQPHKAYLENLNK